MPRRVVPERSIYDDRIFSNSYKALATYEDYHIDDDDQFNIYVNWPSLLKPPKPSKIYELGIFDDFELSTYKCHSFFSKNKEKVKSDEFSNEDNIKYEEWRLWDCYKFVQKMAIMSRIYIFILQFIGANLFGSMFHTDAFYGADYRIQHGKTSSYWGEILVRNVFAGLRRWDSQYFLFLIDADYMTEKSLAFFPGYVGIVNFSRMLLSIYLKSTLDISIPVWFATAITAVVINFVFFLIAAHILFLVSYQLTRDIKVSLISVALFCYNPASIFFSAAYSESTFAATTFTSLFLALLACKMDNLVGKCVLTLLYAVLFSSTVLIRSNGLLNVGYAVWYMFGAIIWEPENPLPSFSNLRERLLTTRNRKLRLEMTREIEKIEVVRAKQRKEFRIGMEGRSRLVSVLIVVCFLSLILVVVLPPFAMYGYHISKEFCDPDGEMAQLAQHIMSLAPTNDVVAGQPKRARWCKNPLIFGIWPSFYSHIQKKYWNVGLFSYWQFRKIPCFLLATPAFILTILAIQHAFKDAFEKKKWRNFWVLCGRNDNLVPYAVHAGVLLFLGVFVINAEVFTRIIFSASPLIPVYLATWIARINEGAKHGNRMLDYVNANPFVPFFILKPVWNTAEGKMLILYFMGYFVFGTMAHAAWLPFT